MIEFQVDGVFSVRRGLHQVRRGDRFGGHLAVVVALDERLDRAGEFRPADQREMAASGWFHPERGHDAHVRIILRQGALFLAQHVARSRAAAHAARVRPDLKNVVVLHVGKVFLPRGGHFQKQAMVGFPSVTSRRTIGALVVLALVPEDAANAVGQFRLLHAPEHATVDGGEVGGLALAALVLVDAGATDSGVDHENRHFLAGEQAFRQLHAPPSEFGFFTTRRFPNRKAPQVFGGFLAVGGGPTVAADPLAGFRRRFLTGVGRQRVRLAIDDVCIAADDVAHGVEHFFRRALFAAELDLVLDQSGFEFYGKRVGLVRREFEALGFLQLVVGIEFEKHRVSGFFKCAVVKKRAFVLVIAGVKLALQRFLVGGGNACEPWVALRFGHRDADALGHRLAAVADRCGDFQFAAVLRAFEQQFSVDRFLDHRDVATVPIDLQVPRPLGFHGG